MLFGFSTVKQVVSKHKCPKEDTDLETRELQLVLNFTGLLPINIFFKIMCRKLIFATM